MTQAEGFVGIDVSKARLDVALGFAGELFGVDNDARGVAELVGQLRKQGPELIVLESQRWPRDGVSGRTGGGAVTGGGG
jgi:hypothetical protein